MVGNFMKYLISLCVNIICASTLVGGTLTFGVVPQQSPVKLINDWKPVVKYLEKETGEKIILKIERSIPEFEKVLYNGGYDIAYMNPYHYVIAHTKQGYKAKIRDVKNIVGILIIRKDSDIRDISNLKGKTFLFPAPDAFAATLLTKYELLKQYGINVNGDKNYRYVNSHDSVYKGVARGIGDVGGGIERTYNDLDDNEAKEALKILYRTKPYPSHPFAFKPSISDVRKDKIVKALLGMPEELLTALSMKQLKNSDDSEFNSVRDIANALPSTME